MENKERGMGGLWHFSGFRILPKLHRVLLLFNSSGWVRNSFVIRHSSFVIRYSLFVKLSCI